jgi:hypothetical protein
MCKWDNKETKIHKILSTRIQNMTCNSLICLKERKMKNMLESNHRESEPWGSKARPITGITSTALGREKWWYTSKLFGMNSLKGEAMWYVDPLLGNDCEISNCVTAVPK